MTQEIQKVSGDLPQEIGEWERQQTIIREHMQRIRESTRETPLKYVKERDGPGGRVKYVGDEYMRLRLDEYFPGWSFQVVDRGVIGPPTLPKAFAWVHGRLVLPMPGIDGGAGPQRLFDDIGEHPVEYTSQSAKAVDGDKEQRFLAPVAGAMKSAHTDAFKRCVRFALQLAHDIYRPEDELNDLDDDDLKKLEKVVNRIKDEIPKASGTGLAKLRACAVALADALDNPRDADRSSILSVAKTAMEVMDANSRG